MTGQGSSTVDSWDRFFTGLLVTFMIASLVLVVAVGNALIDEDKSAASPASAAASTPGEAAVPSGPEAATSTGEALPTGEAIASNDVAASGSPTSPSGASTASAASGTPRTAGSRLPGTGSGAKTGNPGNAAAPGPPGPSGSGGAPGGSSNAKGPEASAAASPAPDGQSIQPIPDLKVPPGEERQGVTDSEILVGADSGVSGVVAFPGGTQYPAAYLQMINDQGGINGRKFRYIVYDDTSTDENRALANVRRLNEVDKFFAHVGGAHCCINSIWPYLHGHGVPYFASTSDNFNSQKYLNVFPTETLSVQCRVTAAYAASKGAKKMSLFTINVKVANDCANAATAAGKKVGLDVVSRHEQPFGYPDYTGDIIQARNAGADVVFTATEHGSGIRIKQAARRQNWKPKFNFIAPLDVYNIEIGRALGDYADGNIFAGPVIWTTQNQPEVTRFVSTVKKYIKNPAWDASGIPSWVGTKLFVDGIKALGSDVTRSRLMGWAASQRAFDSFGLTQPIDFSRRFTGWAYAPTKAAIPAEIKCGTKSPVTGDDCDLYSVDGWVQDPLGGNPDPEYGLK